MEFPIEGESVGKSCSLPPWQGKGQKQFKAHQPLRPQLGGCGGPQLQNPSPPLGSPEAASAQGLIPVGRVPRLKEI